MESKKVHHRTSACFAIVTIFIFFFLIKPSDCDRPSRDATSAMREMSRLFRSVFPLAAPGHTHFFWRTKELGGATVLHAPKEKGSAEVAPDPPAPFRLQIEFRKRGPDCMRKCILQGMLHPVQCHSLC